MKFVVLGGYGIIGKVVVADLARFSKNSEIVIAGRNLEKAKQYSAYFKSKNVKAVKVDINDMGSLAKTLRGADVCVNCVQYYFNLQIMKACLKARVNYVDLGGMFHTTKKQLRLNSGFKKINKLAVLGCGSAPGISNLLVAYGLKFLKKIDSVEMLFADVDKTKYSQPFVLPYSFKSLVDEYTLKPAVLQNGKLKFVQPYNGFKKYNLGLGFGKQKEFLTLHSEIATLPLFLKDKGIKKMEFRIPFEEDSSEIIRTLIETGFTSKDKINLNREEFEILNITAALMDGFLPKKETKIHDKETIKAIFNNGKLAMDAVTSSTFNIPGGTYNTGVPCSIIAQMTAHGGKNVLKEERGVYAPEKVINPDIFFRELRKRGILIYKNGRKVN